MRKPETKAKRNVSALEKRSDIERLVVQICTGKTMSSTYQETRILANRVREIDLELVLRCLRARKDTYDNKKWHTDIDALSCFMLHSDYMVVSTSGANPNLPWLSSFIMRDYEIFCGFDIDETG